MGLQLQSLSETTSDANAAAIELSASEFYSFLEQQILRADNSRVLTLMMLNLRRADRLLAQADTPRARKITQVVRDRLASVLRPVDRFAWVSPNMAWLALPALPSQTVGVVAASKILKYLQMPFVVEGATVHMRPCIGLSSHPEHAITPEQLLETADCALQEARSSEDGYAVYRASADDHARHSGMLEIELRKALQNNALEVHYQPQVDLASGRCHSAEALVRWTREDGRAVSPALIAEVAETTGLMHALTHFVLNTVLRELSGFLRAGVDIGVSVNLSARMLSDSELPEMVWQALQTWGIAPQRVTFEVTESSIIHDIDRSIQMLQSLKELDVQLSIDDFGTGYSSLAYLRRFPLNELKIDRLFIVNMLRSRGDVQIVRSVIDLAHNFELKAVAEGVEDEHTLALLRQLGCDTVQGFWFSKALPVEGFKAWWHALHQAKLG